MSNTIVGKIIILLLLILSIVLLFNLKEDGYTRVYDCSMAEWHPDIPKAVKEECRKIRMEEWKNRNNEDRPQSYRT